MYTAVLERTREIGILKSMGASKTTIVFVVLRETGRAGRRRRYPRHRRHIRRTRLLLHFFPTQHFEISMPWMAKAAGIAFAGAILGALYPAWMAARKDPIDALAYE